MSPRISLEYQRVLELFRTVQGRRLLWTRFGKRRRLMVASRQLSTPSIKIISTRDDLSRKVAVGRARDKTGGEENIGKRCFPNGQKSWPATDRPTSFKIHH
ncbi:hypothetical protein D6D20_09754 [Aureobasidium pullulans]|uniref:Uncharacterized protein n=1 Tax=Aureobasidium pullulans TaxID=5580 RepID=A0A4V4I7W1_AURPU|nr:hypothetical protein D6D26_05259 [Aureobasidium pullulans]THW55077.1 hypothetical protein D6D20_09754 [Aureobasidium pullulans]